MMPGALFVMMPGLMWMPALFADSWATPDSMPLPIPGHTLAKEMVLLFWMM